MTVSPTACWRSGRWPALPPFMYQALLRAEAKELATAIEFLQQARKASSIRAS